MPRTENNIIECLLYWDYDEKYIKSLSPEKRDKMTSDFMFDSWEKHIKSEMRQENYNPAYSGLRYNKKSFIAVLDYFGESGSLVGDTSWAYIKDILQGQGYWLGFDYRFRFNGITKAWEWQRKYSENWFAVDETKIN